MYRASLSGDMTTLHTFDLTGGSKPYNLLLASNGRLYGTTAHGGDTGGGTVWTMDGSGAGFRVMSSFRVNSWLQGSTPSALWWRRGPRGTPTLSSTAPPSSAAR